MGQVHTVELVNLPHESLNPGTYFDRLVTESRVLSGGKDLIFFSQRI